jgi:hypothetical protein
MLPHDQAKALEEFEKKHGMAAVVRCRKGQYTAELKGEVLPLETVGQRAMRLKRERIGE